MALFSAVRVRSVCDLGSDVYSIAARGAVQSHFTFLGLSGIRQQERTACRCRALTAVPCMVATRS
eukprot:800050-Rhodomonas_salina.2